MITRADFLQWKKDPVTKEVFNIFDEILKNIEADMLSPSLIRDELRGQLKLNEMLGYRTALNDILDFEILETDEESNNEKS